VMMLRRSVERLAAPARLHGRRVRMPRNGSNLPRAGSRRALARAPIPGAPHVVTRCVLWSRFGIATTLPASRSRSSEEFGAEGRGAFYETAGCLRDVIENHLFQVVALLAMEPPTYRGFGAVQSAKADVFRAMRPLAPNDLVCGQFVGYRNEPGVAKDSDVETFCALRLFIDSWRWAGGTVVPVLR
jgi:Glucose-6-phosphate dehydrogenase, C-terminal domain